MRVLQWLLGRRRAEHFEDIETDPAMFVAQSSAGSMAAYSPPDLILTSIASERITVGTIEFAEEIYSCLLLGGARDRFKAAERLRQQLSQIFKGNAAGDPIYQLNWVYPGDPQEEYEINGLIKLVFLPSFFHPARAFVFVRPDHGSPLGLLEIWHHDHPAFGRICPGDFLANYFIPNEEAFTFRAAIIEILKLRGAPRNMLFHERDEKID